MEAQSNKHYAQEKEVAENRNVTFDGLLDIEQSIKAKQNERNRLAKELAEVEDAQAKGQDYYDTLCFENTYLEDLLEREMKLIANAGEEKKILEESVFNLREEIKFINEEIEKEKKARNDNLTEYENQVSVLSELFLEKHKNFDEPELNFAIKQIEEAKQVLETEYKKIQSCFHRIQMRKENIENSYMQMQSTFLQDSQKLINEYSEEMDSLRSENQKLTNKTENLARYLKDANSKVDLNSFFIN